MNEIKPPRSVGEVIERLLDGGWDPTTLASALSLPVEEIIELVPEERRREAAADAQLQLAMRALAWRTIEEAMTLLDEGSVSVKLKLIQKNLGDLGRAIAVTDKDDLEDLRSDFRALTAEMRSQRADD